ncbi:YlaH-like family protein [Paenibacillus sp. GYB003]|uniref:YlaH-like family protein n=1 Tax=Paenibacillus sp. GYB003 TaxID=2994392 RepID=UPI002F9695DD
MQQWLFDHPVVTYILILVFLIYIYNKVFRMRKLPLLKDAVIYLTIAVGAFILLLFQLDLELPIVISLGVAVALMLTVRVRYWMIDRENRKKAQNGQAGDGDGKPGAADPM